MSTSSAIESPFVSKQLPATIELRAPLTELAFPPRDKRVDRVPVFVSLITRAFECVALRGRRIISERPSPVKSHPETILFREVRIARAFSTPSREGSILSVKP